MKPQSDSLAEHDVRAAAARGGAFAFVQVTKNAGHVRFSHRAHTVLAKLSCAQCHGDVTQWVVPPAYPDPILMSMDACIDCHRHNAGPTNCRACHQ
jgi:hypothetical protein